MPWASRRTWPLGTEERFVAVYDHRALGHGSDHRPDHRAVSLNMMLSGFRSSLLSPRHPLLAMLGSRIKVAQAQVTGLWSDTWFADSMSFSLVDVVFFVDVIV